MIEYNPTSEFVAWFERSIPEAQRMNRRLDDAFADRKQPKPAVTVMEWQKRQADTENQDRDRLRCETIRAQSAEKLEQQQKLVRCGRALLVWLVALALFVAGLVWMVQR